MVQAHRQQHRLQHLEQQHRQLRQQHRKRQQALGSIQVKAGAAGKVFQVPTSVGQKVEAGDTVIIIEAMKMEIPVVAPEAGTIASIDVAVGDAVESGAVLATLN